MIKIKCEPKNGMPIELIKKMNQVSCKIRIDNEQGYITIEDYPDNDVVDDILDCINAHYNISVIDIDNVGDCSNTTNKQLKASDVKPISPKRKRRRAKKTVGPRMCKEELAITEIIGDKLEGLGKEKPNTETINQFLLDIGMNKIKNNPKQAIMSDVFTVAFNVNKINYENIISELLKLESWSRMDKDNLKATIKSIFKAWISKYPIIKEECPKISLSSMLKVFVKHFQN